MVEPALAHRTEQRLAGDARLHRERVAAVIQNRAKSAARVGPIHVVLHVFLARANELDRAPHRFGCLHRLQHIIRHDLTAEASAEKRDVDLDGISGAADRVRHRLLARADGLDRPPHLDRAVLVARRGVDRLERGVGDVRQQKAPLDDRGRTFFQNLPRLTPLQRGDALLGVQAGLQHGFNLDGGQIGGDAAVELDVERIERAVGLPEPIGYDADGIVPRQIRQLRMLHARVFIGDGERRELYHRMHAGHFQYFGFILDRGHLPGKSARRLDGGVEHAGHHDVDAEHRAAVAFPHRVQTRQWFSDQVEAALVFQGRVAAERQLGGRSGEVSVREPLAARIDDEAVLAAALSNIDIPLLRRGADEHVAGRGAGNAQAPEQRRGRHRGALLLRRRLLAECNLVGSLAGYEPDLDTLPIGVELVGENLRQRRIRALPHLRLRQAKRDLPARRDRDPVGDLVVALRGASANRHDK